MFHLLVNCVVTVDIRNRLSLLCESVFCNAETLVPTCHMTHSLFDVTKPKPETEINNQHITKNTISNLSPTTPLTLTRPPSESSRVSKKESPLIHTEIHPP